MTRLLILSWIGLFLWRSWTTEAYAQDHPPPESFSFCLPDKDNQRIHLSSFEGKYVLVNFWDPECEDCRHETRKLLRLAREFGEDRLIVYRIGVGTSEEVWRRSVSRPFPPNFVNVWCPVLDRMRIIPELKVTVVPYSFLLSPSREVLLKGEITIEQIQQALEK